MDKIFIRDLQIPTIIGTLEFERHKVRNLVVNVELATSTMAAGQSDDLTKSVDYQELAGKLLQLGKTSQFLLIERFAERAAEICLENSLVKEVKLTVDKPGALPESRSVAVEIVRRRPTV